MSSWTCESCTFINDGACDRCHICYHYRLQASSLEIGAAAQRYRHLKWKCGACTFLNDRAQSICSMCWTPKLKPAMATKSIMQTFDSSLRGGYPRESRLSCVRLPSSRIVDSSRTGQMHPFHTPPTIPNLGVGFCLSPCKPNVIYGDPAPISNNFLRRLYFDSMASKRNLVSDHPKHCNSRNLSSVPDSKECIAILMYNVWFREDIHVVARMNAIGDIIYLHKPHFICFQEVTPNIFQIFQQSAWWQEYTCSITPAQAVKRRYFCMQLSRIPVNAFQWKPFANSVMGRELCLTKVDLGKANLVVATTHLESPCPAPPTWDQMFSSERVLQAEMALTSLKDLPNVVFGGDMNWDDGLDGSPPLPEGWCDAWLKLKPGQDGFTYDCKANMMLTGRHLQKRLDRIFCHMQDFQLESIEVVGTCPIPGISYQKQQKVKQRLQKLTLPVLPSDHFGLLLKICPTF